MNIVKKVAISATALAGVATLGVSALYAAQTTTTTNRVDPMSSLVQAIATKFHLNATDVQQVFDQSHQEMEQKMQAQHAARLAEMLAKAVTDGKLTQAQADLIKAKQAEMKTSFDAMKTQTLTDAERKTAMDAQRTALEAWVKANNIPEEYARFVHGFGGPMGGPGGRGGMHKGGFPGMKGNRGKMAAPTLQAAQ